MGRREDMDEGLNIEECYSIIVSSSIRSKCFLLSVEKGRLYVIAVAAINKSAISICFLFLFKLLLMLTAVSTTASSKGTIVIACSTLSQNSI
jgi:hypothetical protein